MTFPKIFTKRPCKGTIIHVPRRIQFKNRYKTCIRTNKK